MNYLGQFRQNALKKIIREGNDINYSIIPKEEWIWNMNEFGYRGVHTFEGKLVWFTHFSEPLAGGGALVQTFEDFILNGCTIGDVPEYIVNQIYEVLC